MTSKSTRHGKMKLYRSDGQNGIFGVYPYLTRLQVAKFALAGGNYYRREQNYKLSGL
jgi:hypothetical protein